MASAAVKLPESTFPSKFPELGKDFEYTKAGEVHAEMECLICVNPLLEPIELQPCQHCFCRECLVKAETSSSLGKRCSMCREEVTGYGRPNRIVTNVVDSLEVRCLRCLTWCGPRESLLTHECGGKVTASAAAEMLEKFKKDGNAILSKGDIQGAIDMYTKGINEVERFVPADVAVDTHLLYSNRALAHSKLENWAACHSDTCSAIALRGNFKKAYLRRAIAAWHRQLPLGEVLEDLRTASSEFPEAKAGVEALEEDPSQHISSAMYGEAPPRGWQPRKPVKKSKEAEGEGAPKLAAASAPELTEFDKMNIAAEHSHALLKAYWQAAKDDLGTWLAAATEAARKELIREAAFIPGRKGNTIDANGEDCEAIARLLPGLNVTDLVRDSGKALCSLIDAVAEVPWPRVMRDSVVEIADILEHQVPPERKRDQYILSLVEEARAVCGLEVVDAVTGKEIPASTFQVGPHTSMEERRKLMDNRTNRNWIALPFRAVAVKRILLQCETLLAIVASFLETHKNEEFKILPRPSNAFGCIACGKRAPSPSVVCECKLVRFCSPVCMNAARGSWHGECTAEISFGDAIRTGIEKMGDQIRKKMHIDPTLSVPLSPYDGHRLEATRSQCLSIIKKFTKWKKCEEDPFGNGDQAPVVDGRRLRETGMRAQEFRECWCSGMDFCPDIEGALPQLHIACFHGDVDLVKEYVDFIPEEKRKNELNRRVTLMRFNTILSTICGARAFGIQYQRPQSGHLELLKFLLEEGASPHAADVFGMTTLHHCASGMGNDLSTAMIGPLARAGADPDIKNRMLDTPVAEALTANKVDIVKELLLFGASGDQKMSSGMPLSMMAQQLCPQIMPFLLAYGPNKGLKEGDEVEIKEVQSKPHLNGKRGVVEDRGNARVTVKLPDADAPISLPMLKVIRPSNSAKKGAGKGQAASASSERVLVLKMVEGQNYVNMSGTSHTNNDPKRRPKGKFMAKVQVPLNPRTGQAIPGMAMAIMNERQTFVFMATSETPDGLAVHQLVTQKGVRGAKAYFNCECKNGDLHVYSTVLPPQPW